MKDLSLLAWFTQLGLSVAIPPAVLILLAAWLQDRFGWGQWVLWIAIFLGLYCAVTGLISSLRTLSRLTKGKEKAKVISFNDHE